MKVNTYLSVLEQEPAFEFVDHRNCRLGKWYYEGEGQASFSTMPSFRGLQTPHAHVHDATRRVFSLLEIDDDASCTMLTDALDSMEQASEEVFRFLDRILSEKMQQIGEGN